MSVRWKLFATYLLVILVAVGTLGIYLDHEMRGHVVASLERSLASEARLIADVVSQDFAAPKRDRALNDAALRFGREAELRVTLIARDGVVLGDSEHDFRTMDNHASRPEVRQAFARGLGRSIRYSRTIGVDMLYVAVPARRGGDAVGVVRLAVPLHQVAATLGRIRSMVLIAVLVTVVLALLLSMVLSQRFGAAVAAIRRAAQRMADGDLDATVRLRDGGELATLAESLNEMAARLRIMVRELREEKQKVETILARLGEAILVTDAQGRITVCNLAAERVFGCRAEDVLGMSVVDATQNRALDEAFRQARATGRPAAAEVQVIFPQPRALEATVTPIAADDTPGAVAILHDVTELRRLEGVRREFVANASHELQTPVTAIKAMTEALLADGRSDEALADRFLRDLGNQADRVGALVRDLLDLAAIEAGPMPLESVSIDLAELVEGVAASLQSLADRRGVVISIDIPDGIALVSDPSALTRVLANLLDNAIKYTESGGQVGVRAERRGEVIAITVWDTGIGIPADDLPHIFERFYRVDKARSRELGGTGLGLAIVKHLVEPLGGEVLAESQPGRGSRFTVTLPAAE